MGGIYRDLSLADIADKAFYGMNYNATTGHLSVDIIDDETPIVLPQDNEIQANGYKEFFWSKDAISFSVDSRGHLLMRFL